METILLIAGLGVKVGRVYPHLRLQPLARQRHRLQVRLQMALILLMGLVALGMGTQFVEIGQTVLVVLNTGYLLHDVILMILSLMIS